MPVFVVKHPLLEHKLSILRNLKTSTRKFRELVNEITTLLAYEATRDLELQDIEVETPITRTVCKELKDPDIVIIPILRAGLGMVEGMQRLLPTARVFHLGLKRDEKTFSPVSYYNNLKNLKGKTVFVVDPMLATAGSLSAAISAVRDQEPARINAVTVIASPEGKARIETEHPDVNVFTASLDDHLNENAYIVPGLGDAGDRIFGTC